MSDQLDLKLKCWYLKSGHPQENTCWATCQDNVLANKPSLSQINNKSIKTWINAEVNDPLNTMHQYQVLCMVNLHHKVNATQWQRPTIYNRKWVTNRHSQWKYAQCSMVLWKKMVHIATQYEFYRYCKAKTIKHAYNICERIKGMGRKGQEQRQEIIVNF